MTLQEIKDSTKDILTPGDVAHVLGCDPNLIRYQARKDIKSLGFPCSIMGSRIKIPRVGFLNWWEAKQE